MPDFKNYLDLLSKVNDKFDEIYQANKADFSCASGCHSCCLPDLSVSRIEKEYIKEHLLTNEEVKKTVEDIEKLDPHNGARCKMLAESGECSIYEVRPVVCRSHGAPTQLPSEDGGTLDVCPLNFKDVDLNTISQDHKINLSLLNTLLALINMKEFPSGSEKRSKLTLSSILED